MAQEAKSILTSLRVVVGVLVGQGCLDVQTHSGKRLGPSCAQRERVEGWGKQKKGWMATFYTRKGNAEEESQTSSVHTPTLY